MKVQRSTVGAIVRLVWRDPTTYDTDDRQPPVGRAGLTQWTEYGRIAAVADGVVTLVHAEVTARGDLEARPRYQGSCIPEDLVESITVLLEPEGRRGGGGGEPKGG
ncbi:MAG: hypothetical protein QN130_12400 [Armatimonadota bacterium]|nr:hypothetical protein [Armatimonadota bacterium]